MRRLIGHRVLISIPQLFVISILTFVLEQLVPGDAARAVAGPTATPEQYMELRHELGLDRPVWEQYGAWLNGVIHGSLGASLFTGRLVASDLNSRLPVTLSLMCGVLLVCVALGTMLGTLSAVREGASGRLIDALSMAGLAMPGYWVALLFIALFAVGLHLLPATGYTNFSDSPADWLRGLILPVAALSLGAVTVMAKQTRDSMRDVLARPFIRALRASGVSGRSIVWKHGLKNAALPLATLVGVLMVSTLSGTVFVENVFVLPGLGSLAVQATESHDLPVIEGIALYFTVITILINLAVDIAYGWLNPKVRVA